MLHALTGFLLNPACHPFILSTGVKMLKYWYCIAPCCKEPNVSPSFFQAGMRECCVGITEYFFSNKTFFI